MRRFAIPAWLDGLIFGAPFPSRKNLVFRASRDGRSCIAKVFAEESSDRAATEFEVLGLCKRARLRAPRPLLLRDNVILMTRLPGRTAFEALFGPPGGPESRAPAGLLLASATPARSPLDRGPAARVLDGVARWLCGFHEAFRRQRRRGDSILKNFMLSGRGVAGFDFEESVEGDPLADVGQLVAHLLASGDRFSAPLFGAARHFASRYWHHSGGDRSGELPRAVSEGLEGYARFREDGALLRSWAGRIRKRGLACLPGAVDPDGPGKC